MDLLPLIDSAGIPFYEGMRILDLCCGACNSSVAGCLVVELQDFREPPAVKDKKGDEVRVKTEGGPISSRVVLRPGAR